MKNNKIVVDLNKVSYAWRSWVTTCGNYKRQDRPTAPTVHGHEFDCEAPARLVFNLQGTEELGVQTMLQRAHDLGILDIWIPCTTLQVQANHRLTYTGEKAGSIWKAWCEKQFNKKEKK
jgi:hypothetical protein